MTASTRIKVIIALCVVMAAVTTISIVTLDALSMTAQAALFVFVAALAALIYTLLKLR